MFDIWAFLLQTLTASGVAVLLLIVKAMFRDKLPPKWQFGIWGILVLVLLIPAGLGGRYVLFQWPVLVELLKSLLAGEYTITRVLFPIPVVNRIPETVWDWVFAVYAVGVLAHLLNYTASYIRLRSLLHYGEEAEESEKDRIAGLARHYGLPLCRIVVVPGLPSAFVCGIFRPVLVLPEEEVDEKVILHELLHLKSRDTAWSILICVLRSIHWCNPLLTFCAGRAGNDLEARCDQRVLELLEGEQRRDYGRILLSMANDRYAGTPGATCVNNGGKNIRRRIEAIARFRLYPAGMKLVSICAALILALPLVMGVQAAEVYGNENRYPRDLEMEISMASARTTHCTTPAGAFDAYAKAILTQNGIYRMMCAPEGELGALAQELLDRHEDCEYPNWDIGVICWPYTETGYQIYNLTPDRDGYRGLLVFQLNYSPDGAAMEMNEICVATQELRVFEENGRWVTETLGAIQTKVIIREDLGWGCRELPAVIYTGTYENYQIDVRYQTVWTVDNYVWSSNGFWGSSASFDTKPKPNAEFSETVQSQSYVLTHLGTQEERDGIQWIGVSLARVMEGDAEPEMMALEHNSFVSGGSSSGQAWINRPLSEGWGPYLDLHGGGSTIPADPDSRVLPAYYAAELYINNEFVTFMKLLPKEGGLQ